MPVPALSMQPMCSLELNHGSSETAALLYHFTEKEIQGSEKPELYLGHSFSGKELCCQLFQQEPQGPAMGMQGRGPQAAANTYRRGLAGAIQSHTLG